MKGAGALIVTYGVGDLAALSGTPVPMPNLAGDLHCRHAALHAMKNHQLLHHTQATVLDNVMNCFKQFTVAQALITPENAAQEIPRVISRAR